MRTQYLLGLSLLLAIAVPAAAERPTPPAARHFQAALSKGDLRAAQRVVASGAPLVRSSWEVADGTSAAVTLTEIINAAHDCSAEPASSSRDLEDPREMHVVLSWACAGDRSPLLNLDVISGRVTRVDAHLGPPVPLLPHSGPFPIAAVDVLARSFLFRLLGDRDVAAARTSLTSEAELIDRRSGRSISLASIADLLEPCSLRGMASGSGRSVVTRWDCPRGSKAISIDFNGNDVSRIEVLPAAGHAEQ